MTETTHSLRDLVEVQVEVGDRGLPGNLGIPADAKGLVLFAHGSGSSRFSPRNRLVAGLLHQEGIATLLFDLLTETEGGDRANVFDIPLLGGRLAEAHAWVVAGHARVAGLPIGYFGASTGAAAALVAAAQKGSAVSAVVSRGGRPDLAGAALARVKSPTLLIVGGYDTQVLRLNRLALEQLTCTKALEIVPGATHLFEEPGTLERAAGLAANWFDSQFSGVQPLHAR